MTGEQNNNNNRSGQDDLLRRLDAGEFDEPIIAFYAAIGIQGLLRAGEWPDPPGLPEGMEIQLEEHPAVHVKLSVSINGDPRRGLTFLVGPLQTAKQLSYDVIRE